MTIWTAEADAILIANRPNLSAAKIGLLIGCSRNAVIGRSHRLGLECIKPVGRPKVAKIVLAGVRKPATVVKFQPPPMPVAALNVPFLDLERHHCREIVGSEGIGQTLSCGHPVVAASSYCRFHHSIFYFKPARRNVQPLAA